MANSGFCLIGFALKALLHSLLYKHDALRMSGLLRSSLEAMNSNSPKTNLENQPPYLFRASCDFFSEHTIFDLAELLSFI